jgi:integrase
LAEALIPFNPVGDTDPPRKVKPKLEVLSTEQVGQFVRTSARKRLFPLYIVGALTGLRAGELLGLSWDDLTTDPKGRPLLRIRRKLVNSSRGVEIDEEGTKTGEGRSVGLTKLGEAVLKIHRKRQLEERMRAGADWTETGLIFTSKRGGYIHPTNVSQYLRRDLEKAGLLPIRFHDLRHSFATVLAGAGAHVAIVAGMLGHKDARTTLNTYTHYLPTMQDWAMERLDELFPVALLDELEASPENVRSRS